MAVGCFHELHRITIYCQHSSANKVVLKGIVEQAAERRQHGKRYVICWAMLMKKVTIEGYL